MLQKHAERSVACIIIGKITLPTHSHSLKDDELLRKSTDQERARVTMFARKKHEWLRPYEI